MPGWKVSVSVFEVKSLSLTMAVPSAVAKTTVTISSEVADRVTVKLKVVLA